MSLSKQHHWHCARGRLLSVLYVKLKDLHRESPEMSWFLDAIYMLTVEVFNLNLGLARLDREKAFDNTCSH